MEDIRTTVNRESILQEAIRCVCGEREQQYGSPENNFKTIANLWSTYLNHDIAPMDVAAMMILLKVARVASGNSKNDNWVDIAGYAACGGELQNHVEG
jgi:hypothetical protein